MGNKKRGELANYTAVLRHWQRCHRHGSADRTIVPAASGGGTRSIQKGSLRNSELMR